MNRQNIVRRFLGRTIIVLARLFALKQFSQFWMTVDKLAVVFLRRRTSNKNLQQIDNDIRRDEAFDDRCTALRSKPHEPSWSV
jgi:hypothetical protein